MPRPAKSSQQTIRQFALRYPETEESVVCNRAAFKAGNKSFLFLGENDDGYDVMVKLRDLLPEAAEFAAAEPTHYKIGGHDWVTITFPQNQSPPAGLLERWIAESFCLLAPKSLVAQAGQPIAKAASMRRSRRR